VIQEEKKLKLIEKQLPKVLQETSGGYTINYGKYSKTKQVEHP
jgi:hypothetical protein